MNWTVINDDLIYNLINDKNIIDPLEVHLHCRVGDTHFDVDYFINNPTYYNHYFSSPNSKIYKAIKSQLVPEKVEVFDLTTMFPPLSKLSIKARSERINDPRFFTFKHQIYGQKMDHVMFSGIMCYML